MTIHRNFIALIVAVFYAILVLIVSLILGSPDVWLRMGMVMALYLISRDTLASADIAKGRLSIANPARWVMAFYLSLYFGAFILLILWRGMFGFSSQFTAIIIGSIIFGALMAFYISKKPYRYPHHFQIEKTKLADKTSQFIYYLAPALKLFLICAMMKYGPQTPAYLFFYIILIGFALPRYSRKNGDNFFWANSPTLIGYLILGLSLLLTQI